MGSRTLYRMGVREVEPDLGAPLQAAPPRAHEGIERRAATGPSILALRGGGKGP